MSLILHTYSHYSLKMGVGHIPLKRAMKSSICIFQEEKKADAFSAFHTEEETHVKRSVCRRGEKTSEKAREEVRW